MVSDNVIPFDGQKRKEKKELKDGYDFEQAMKQKQIDEERRRKERQEHNEKTKRDYRLRPKKKD